MHFSDDILSFLGLSEVTGAAEPKVILAGNGAYIENVKSIKFFSYEKIQLIVKKGMIEITGSDLTIKKCCGGDMAICGKISSVSIN